MQWVLCMPQLFLLEYKIQDLFSQSSLWRGPSSTGREQLECTQLYLMLLLRHVRNTQENENLCLRSQFFPLEIFVFLIIAVSPSAFSEELIFSIMQIVIELPYILVQTITYGVLVYAMMGFEWTFAKFLWYLFFMYFTLLYFTAYGMMSAAVTPNPQVASIASSAVYSMWNIFSGFIIPKTVSSIILARNFDHQG